MVAAILPQVAASAWPGKGARPVMSSLPCSSLGDRPIVAARATGGCFISAVRFWQSGEEGPRHSVRTSVRGGGQAPVYLGSSRFPPQLLFSTEGDKIMRLLMARYKEGPIRLSTTIVRLRALTATY
ncbi:hypothetical protein VTJ04DRAFT_10903 [Mycothermus thermophilus]|uniref:uncharacterized protein n=1 Tax=Humicola insolens TaxID=85995 RepID=UPI0037426606